MAYQIKPQKPLMMINNHHSFLYVNFKNWQQNIFKKLFQSWKTALGGGGEGVVKAIFTKYNLHSVPTLSICLRVSVSTYKMMTFQYQSQQCKMKDVIEW